MKAKTNLQTSKQAAFLCDTHSEKNLETDKISNLLRFVDFSTFVAIFRCLTSALKEQVALSQVVHIGGKIAYF